MTDPTILPSGHVRPTQWGAQQIMASLVADASLYDGWTNIKDAEEREAWRITAEGLHAIISQLSELQSENERRSQELIQQLKASLEARIP